MAAWINFALLLALSAATVTLYCLSVRPEAWSRRIGPRAYPLSGRIRTVSMVTMFLALGCFILYSILPLPIPLARTLPWPYAISFFVALGLTVPAGYFLVRGVKDAGEEAAVPDPDTPLFKGVYTQIRHPQAWEAMAWPVLALLLNSPFLLLYSLFWLALEYIMVRSEERDLLLRFGDAYAAYRRQTPAFIPRIKARKNRMPLR
jgi:protein-S-isoprenylcysteine O-methyltransferase Ste14